MRSFFIIINIISISLLFYYKSMLKNQVHEVFVFNGESGSIKITGGIITISSSGEETVDGGKIQYIGNAIKNVKSYTKNIYILAGGNKK